MYWNASPRAADAGGVGPRSGWLQEKPNAAAVLRVLRTNRNLLRPQPDRLQGVRLARTPMEPDHISDEWLEQYSVGAIEEPPLARVEEHLLICESCRKRLTEFDDAWGLNG